MDAHVAVFPVDEAGETKDAIYESDGGTLPGLLANAGVAIERHADEAVIPPYGYEVAVEME